MEYKGTLLAVRDMARSRRFYRDVLGLETALDFGANVTLTGGVILQTLDTWQSFLAGRGVAFGGNDAELYFEEPDMDAFLARIEGLALTYVHAPLTHRWGQRVVRFCDPDGHIIEVGETLSAVARRFAAQGMNAEEIARRMDVPVEFVERALHS